MSGFMSSRIATNQWLSWTHLSQTAKGLRVDSLSYCGWLNLERQHWLKWFRFPQKSQWLLKGRETLALRMYCRKITSQESVWILLRVVNCRTLTIKARRECIWFKSGCAAVAIGSWHLRAWVQHHAVWEVSMCHSPASMIRSGYLWTRFTRHLIISRWLRIVMLIKPWIIEIQ